MNYFCNPLNIDYRYQFNQNQQTGQMEVAREAADPSMICFKGSYYIFASMTLSVWCSEDMVQWKSCRLPEHLPLYDYAPDVRVIGEYVYFSASKRGEICNFYRTRDIINGPYEEIKGSFDFWDPNLFCDEDGKVYFYWGCANLTPLWGVELDPLTMLPKGEKKALIEGDPYTKGFERIGEDHTLLPASEEEVELKYQAFLKAQGMTEEQFPEEYRPLVKGMMSNRPYIEGAWMDKHQDTYYLQYACPGTQYNGYADGVYLSKSPLGPFELARNNPFSYKPGGFIPGAGHGSTMKDKSENLWHTATMRISRNHQFERRVGIWPAGFDQDGELFCNQRYGDWPMSVEPCKMDPWKNPEWFLLSYQKQVTASSFEEGKEPAKAVDENVQTWWRAATEEKGQWIQTDLGEAYMVHAIQINFADDKIEIPVPGMIRGTTQARYIEEKELRTSWILEGSVDGITYSVLKDKSEVKTDLPHDLVVLEDGQLLRFIRLTCLEIPYQQKPCISGLRVFGKGRGELPTVPSYQAVQTTDTDMELTIQETGATGYLILWGHEAEKLYHSCMVFGKQNTSDSQTAVIQKRIGALVKGERYFVRVDSFNENGIQEGKLEQVKVR